jgi:hypothetical protein
VIQNKKELMNDIIGRHLKVQENTLVSVDLVAMLNETFNTAYRMGLIKMFGERVESLEDIE